MNHGPGPSAPGPEEDQVLCGALGNVVALFAIDGEMVSVARIDTGLINSTFRVACRMADGRTRRFIVQAVNDKVFADPVAVMRNVERVVGHCRARLRSKDGSGRFLSLMPARDGGSWVFDAAGVLWRCYEFLDGCVSYDVVGTPELARGAARAFGEFQNLVSDLDPSSLVETIPDFHDTQKRLARLSAAALQDPEGRLAGALAEHDALLGRAALAGALGGPLSRGEIPLRITHNDTKINNVMFDEKTGEAACVIDLDTVMPGIACCDFGDLVRSACNSSAEGETDPSRISFRMPIFEAIADGYLSAAGVFLDGRETALLATSCRVLTYELAVRFLTDHLEGDVYFKVRHPGHNLARCRNQLRLLERMEDAAEEMERVIGRAVERFC